MTNNSKQVSLRNGVDFSRLRKYKPGGLIPKFQTPFGPIADWYSARYVNNSALKNWNSTLNHTNASASIYGLKASSLHGNAGDLNYAWGSNQAYTSDSARVGQDIQTWYNEWMKNNPNATPEQMVAAYNQIAQSIRDYQTREHTYNDTDAADNNRNFKGMFASRSLMNEGEDKSQDMAFIGYQDNIDKYYGSSSFLRRMDQYEKEYEDLTDQEKAARTHIVKFGDKDVLVYKKANGDIALLPPGSNPPGSNPPGSNPPGLTPPGTTPPEQTPPGTDPNPWLVSEYGDRIPQYKFRPFTQPFMNGLALGNNLWNSTRLYQLDTQKKYPLLEGPRQEYKVTNAYAQASADKNALNEAAYRSTQNLGSDLTHNNDFISNAAFKVADGMGLINAYRANEFNTTSKEAQNVANNNTLSEVETANQNTKANSALFNSIIDARKAWHDRNTAYTNDFLDKTYTQWQSHLQNERMERNAYYDRWNQYLYNQDALKAYDNYYNLNKGIEYDQNVLDMIANDMPEGFDTDAFNQMTPEERKEALVNWYTANASTEAGKKYADAHALNIKNAQEQGYADLQQIQQDYQYTKLFAPNTYTGQGIFGWGEGLFNVPVYKSRYQNSGLIGGYRYAKEGGVLFAKQGTRTRFLDYLKHNSKVQEDALKRLQVTSKGLALLLTRDLNALDKEVLLLLRSVFK